MGCYGTGVTSSLLIVAPFAHWESADRSLLRPLCRLDHDSDAVVPRVIRCDSKGDRLSAQRRPNRTWRVGDRREITSGVCIHKLLQTLANPDGSWRYNIHSVAPGRICSRRDHCWYTRGPRRWRIAPGWLAERTGASTFWAERRGKRVESDSLQTVADRGVAGNRRQRFQREHILDDRANLGTLRGTGPREMLVAAEYTGNLTMVAVERVHKRVGCSAIGCVMRQAPPYAWLLDRHRIIDDVGSQVCRERHVMRAC